MASKITRDTKTEVNRLAKRPKLRVTANPRTGPLPNRNRISADTMVVTFARGRVDTQVDVFDVLLDYLHRNPTQIDCRDHQYSRCCLTMRKMRSTSPSSCRDRKR